MTESKRSQHGFELGLPIHEMDMSSDELEVLEVVLDFERSQTRLRFWRTRGTLIHRIRWERVSGMVLEVLVGHSAYYGRRLLSGQACLKSCDLSPAS